MNSTSFLRRVPLKLGIAFGLYQVMVFSNQKAEVLQQAADAEDVVVGAADPEGGAPFHQRAQRRKPGVGEFVVGGEIAHFVPLLGGAIDQRQVGAVEVVLELEVIGRIGEDEVDGIRRQGRQDFEGIAVDQGVCGQGRSGFFLFPLGFFRGAGLLIHGIAPHTLIVPKVGGTRLGKEARCAQDGAAASRTSR